MQSNNQKVVGFTAENMVVDYSVTDAAIAELKSKYIGLKVCDPDSRKQVSEAIQEVSGLRTSVEVKRKELKEDALVWGKKVDAEAKRITALLEEIEEPLKIERRAFDAIKEEEKRKKIEAEAKRVADIEQKIERIRSIGNLSFGDTLETIEAKLVEIKSIVIDSAFEEFQDRALVIRHDAEKRLEDAIPAVKAKAEEAERNRLQAIQQKEESDRLAAERAKIENFRREEEKKLAEERASIEKMREDMENERLANEKAKQALEDAKKVKDEPAPQNEPPTTIEQTVYAGDPAVTMKSWKVRIDLEISAKEKDSISADLDKMFDRLGIKHKLVNIQEIK